MGTPRGRRQRRLRLASHQAGPVASHRHRRITIFPSTCCQLLTTRLSGPSSHDPTDPRSGSLMVKKSSQLAEERDQQAQLPPELGRGHVPLEGRGHPLHLSPGCPTGLSLTAPTSTSENTDFEHGLCPTPRVSSPFHQ